MIEDSLILLLAAAYIGLLFAVAYYGDERADRGRSLISNPYIYALSLAVYCTAWTFYGSVGRAASTGVGFLPIYIGPTLMAVLWWIVLRKIIRISKYHRVTSIADFIGSRYGKSASLAGIVTIVAVMGIVPYIALQLKAMSTSYAVISQYPEGYQAAIRPVFYMDAGFYAALALAAFTILFGTRHLDVAERNEGLVVAIAFESVVKLVAFLAVGLFVTYSLHDGFSDLFAKGAAHPEVRRLFTMDGGGGAYGEWFWLTALSMMAILFLPRQFQVAVVENVDEQHVRKAAWLFPLYLLAINLFVLPIAVSGLLAFSSAADADTFVLVLPLAEGQQTLAILVFIGGISAATSMVIVATNALSTMICNDLVMPVLLRIPALRLAERDKLTGLLLGIRRGAIIIILLLGYAYLHTVGHSYSLVSIGLISFAAVAQFAPSILGGIYWKRGTHAGAMVGLIAGFMVWGYTLPLPSLVETGWLPRSFVEAGPFGWSALRPYALFGLDEFGHIPHAMFWSLLFNGGLYLVVSVYTRQSVMERNQAHLFVDVFKYAGGTGSPTWRGTAQVADLRRLLRRYLGWRRADQALAAYARRHGLDADAMTTADEALVHHTENLLAGVIGAASARVVVASIAQAKPLRIGEVMDILDETQQAIAHSRELEQKRQALERATHELQQANEKLKELDRLKDDFVSTVTHELRTPLTAIRAISEILYAHPGVDVGQRRDFAETILREGERLSRLIDQVLDMQRLEGEPEVRRHPTDIVAVAQDAVGAMWQQMERDHIAFEANLPDESIIVQGDRDRLMQVLLNLLSNAAKFCDTEKGQVALRVQPDRRAVRIEVEDNGPGVHPDDQQGIFEKFRQARHRSGPHTGSGLGLAIAHQIVTRHGGEIGLRSAVGHGATFYVELPVTAEADGAVPGDGARTRPVASTTYLSEANEAQDTGTE